MDTEKIKILKQLRIIPGVGRSIAEDLWNLGIRKVEDLRGKNPLELYQQLCGYQGVVVDRCMLYVFRCAIYYASTTSPDPDLLKWWNWKDRELDLPQ